MIGQQGNVGPADNAYALFGPVTEGLARALDFALLTFSEELLQHRVPMRVDLVAASFCWM